MRMMLRQFPKNRIGQDRASGVRCFTLSTEYKAKALSGMGKALSSFLIVMICIVIGAVVYFMAMLFLKGITKDDLMKMPGGRTVYTIAAKCHLM